MFLVLLALGMLLGIYGSLLIPRGPRAGGHLLSVSVLVAVAGNLTAGLLARTAAGRWGPMAPLVGWLAVVVAFSTASADGSVIYPGGGDLAVSALLFQVLGAVAASIPVVVATAAKRATS